MKIFIPFLLALSLTFPAFAEEAKPDGGFFSAEAIAKNQKTIDRLAAYLSGLSSIVADFTQVAPDGTLTGGKFFLQRPGKMRWQYNPPTPVLMVADGKTLVFYDYELQQVNYIELDSTLIGFLAQKVITFDGQVRIRDFEQKDSVIRITVAQREKPTDGQLMLEFSDKPLLIRNMVITDATNQVTTVSLNNAQYGVAFDKDIFVFKDPRKSRTR